MAEKRKYKLGYNNLNTINSPFLVELCPKGTKDGQCYAETSECDCVDFFYGYERAQIFRWDLALEIINMLNASMTDKEHILRLKNALEQIAKLTDFPK
jgi:hypothetical protein